MTTATSARTVDESEQILEAFERAVSREAHNLTRWPELLSQQLYNDLQFETDPVSDLLTSMFAQRSKPGARPWIRKRNPSAQSGDLLLVLAGHEESVSACAVSPDGRFIVSGSWDHTLKLWDSETGQEIRTLTGHEGGVSACAVSPDGRYIVSASFVDGLKVWDAGTGQELQTFPSHSDLTTFERETRPKLRNLADHAGLVTALRRVYLSGTGRAITRSEPSALGPDGRLVVSRSENDIVFWDADTGEVLQTIDDRRAWATTCCAVSPDGRIVVTGHGNWATLQVWDAVTGDHVRTLEGHSGPVSTCSISPDGRFIVSGSGTGEQAHRDVWTGRTESLGDLTIRFWDAVTGRETRTLAGSGADSCAVSPDGRFVVSASMADTTLKVWNAEAPLRRRGVTTHMGAVHCCAASPDGRFMVSSSQDSTLKIWDTRSGDELRTLTGNQGFAIPGCAVSPDGRVVVSAGDDSTLRIWDSQSGEELRSLKGNGVRFKACAIAPDGTFIVSASGDRTLKTCDVTTTEELRTFKDAGVVSSCAVSPNGRFIVSGSDDGVRLWDPRTGRAFRTMKSQINVSDCAGSPDGAFLVSSSSDATVKLWDSGTGKELLTLAGHSGPVHACAVSPDGRFVVSGGEDKTVRVWDATSGEEVALMPLLGAAYCVALHPWQPIAAAGDATGVFTLVDLLGVEFGPIVVTPLDRGNGPVVRCPSCLVDHVVQPDWPGQVVSCQTPDCGLKLSVSPLEAATSNVAGAVGRIFKRKSRA